MRLQLDSSSLHFSSPGPSPRSIIYRSLEFLLTHYTRFAFHLCGPYFYIPVRTCLRENRYRFDSVPLPLPLLLGGPKERSDLPFRIPESIPYTEYFANPNLRQSLKYISSNHGRLDSGFDRFHEPLRARRSRFDRYACSELGEGILEIFVSFSLRKEHRSYTDSQIPIPTDALRVASRFAWYSPIGRVCLGIQTRFLNCTRCSCTYG